MSYRDLDLDRTMANVELVQARTHKTICSSFKLIEPLFFSYRVHRHTHTQTERQTDRHKRRDRHTDGHEYSIVAVDKPQL